jgi:predicted membrane-bound spermidine synthase
MHAILDYVNRRLQQMPHGLSVLTNVFLLFAFLSPAFTLVCLLAYVLGNHSISGVQVSYSEFWRRMHLLTFFGLGIYSAVLAFGFLHATRWSRPLLLLPFVCSPILGVIHRSSTFTLYNYVSALFTIILFAWYLFFRQTVRDYYAKTQNPVA